jgi:hypothetical protein
VNLEFQALRPVLRACAASCSLPCQSRAGIWACNDSGIGSPRLQARTRYDISTPTWDGDERLAEVLQRESRWQDSPGVRGKLSAIAQVKIGLQSGGNTRFYRAAEGVIGGAAKGGYKEVEMQIVLDEKKLSNLTEDQKKNGIKIDDKSTDRHFLPLDKPAVSDIDGGLLPLFWRPVEFYVDWSEAAVDEMKKLPGARFQGSSYYFRRGISFSNTGIYSPTFRLNHGAVFDQTGSCIFLDVMSSEALLGLLSSTLMKYFVKSFINHGAHAQLDDLPIVIPNATEISNLESKVGEIVIEQKKNSAYDYRAKLAQLDEIVFDIYQITPDEREEIRNWYRRHYPRLFDSDAPEA